VQHRGHVADFVRVDQQCLIKIFYFVTVLRTF
jgi:hypothetical protein